MSPARPGKFRKHGAAEKKPISTEALIDRNHDLRLLFPVNANRLADGSRLLERLIRQHHQRRVRFRRNLLDAGSYRRSDLRDRPR